MPFKSGELSNEFEQANQENANVEVVEAEAPQMIERERPFPHPAPHGLGEDMVNREIFDQRWQQALDANRAPDAFDRVDERAAGLSQDFNTRSRGLER